MAHSPRNSSKGKQTVVGWILWILLTIGSFFLAVGIWTPVIARYFGTIRETNNAILWIVAVFGTWMIFLIPLIVIMYLKVDKAYEDARIRREQASMRYRTIYVDPLKRKLPEFLRQKMMAWPDTIDGGHLTTVILKDGRKIPYVFIRQREEILGIYNHTEYPFEASDIADIEPTDRNNLPPFLALNWLRLDGVPWPE